MKKTNLLIIITIVLSLCLLTGCQNSKLKKYSKYLTKSMNDVSTIIVVAEVKDQNVLVYKYQKNINLNGNDATIEAVTSTLSSSYILEDNATTNSVKDIDRSKLNSITLNKDYFNEFKIESNILKASINANNLSKVLGSDEIQLDGLADLVITYDKKKVIKVDCCFKTASFKDVVITVDYKY